MKATEQYFPVALFIMLYKVVLTIETVGKILKCDHLNEGYCTLYFLVVSLVSNLALQVDKGMIVGTRGWVLAKIELTLFFSF